MESTATTYTYQSTSPIPSIIALILCVIAIVGMWKTFVKAGVPGWHSLIPILNVYDICKIALKENVAFGQQLSAQFVMAYDHDSNIGSYPNIFGTTANTGRDDLIVYFDRSSGNVNNGLKMRPNFKLQNVTRHTMASDWTGPYLNVFYDDLERKKASISNAELPAWIKSNASGTLPSWPYTIGTGRNATQQTRMFVGKISSVRLYNRILTDDELHQNRKVDEIRFNQLDDHGGRSRGG